MDKFQDMKMVERFYSAELVQMYEVPKCKQQIYSKTTIFELVMLYKCVNVEVC